ncbi:unnamed protein product [Bursaphelenchus okinawaensis]|uniref:P53 and DNA damage-regulated protein 1 n=1 Tax=Bursaphelenchus okinawaensis TaxID=465554 RepID=A0A811LSM4_9BILA|nr:unnamed protein product [Bursaphelenchus okinawaensis]CAG9127482.1 unnamed protein product [Bursaphelenchus okinawaensis]
MSFLEPNAEIGADIVRKLTEVQELGQKIVSLRRSVVDMDNKRSKLRESYHAIKRDEKSSGKKENFICICNDLMVEYPNEFALKSLNDDAQKLDKLIEETRKEIKEATGKLLELEGDRDLVDMGFDLKALSDQDFSEE